MRWTQKMIFSHGTVTPLHIYNIWSSSKVNNQLSHDSSPLISTGLTVPQDKQKCVLHGCVWLTCMLLCYFKHVQAWSCLWQQNKRKNEISLHVIWRARETMQLQLADIKIYPFRLLADERGGSSISNNGCRRLNSLFPTKLEITIICHNDICLPVWLLQLPLWVVNYFRHRRWSFECLSDSCKVTCGNKQQTVEGYRVKNEAILEWHIRYVCWAAHAFFVCRT